MSNPPPLLPATASAADEVESLLSEIELVAETQDRNMLEAMELASALLHQIDDVKSRVDAGEEEHVVLDQHLAALGEVAKLLADMEQSAEPSRELTQLLASLASDLAAASGAPRPSDGSSGNQ